MPPRATSTSPPATAASYASTRIRRRNAPDAGAHAGERATYRVVDLNGERAVIELGQSDQSIDPALIEESRAVFDSIEFVRPDE